MKRILSALTALAFASLTALAATPDITVTLSHFTLDFSGPGYVVRLTPIAAVGGIAARALTDSDGVATFENIAPGSYNLTIEGVGVPTLLIVAPDSSATIAANTLVKSEFTAPSQAAATAAENLEAWSLLSPDVYAQTVWTNDPAGWISPVANTRALFGGYEDPSLIEAGAMSSLAVSRYLTTDLSTAAFWSPFVGLVNADDLYDGRLGVAQFKTRAQTNELFPNATFVHTLHVETESGATNGSKTLYDFGNGTYGVYVLDSVARGSVDGGPKIFEDVGVFAAMLGDAARNYGVGSYMYLDYIGNGFQTNSQNAAVFGVVDNADGVADSLSTAGYFELSHAASAQPVMANAAVLAETGVTGYPIFVGRSNKVEKIKAHASGALSNGGNTNRWIFKGVSGGAATVNIDGVDYTFTVTGP
jgi:hypothetical protein